jgi:2-dehydropantoate 2-reductase
VTSSTSASAEPPGAPRTLVVGAGAIGAFLAARLTEAGWPVALLARGATLRRLAVEPLELTDDGRMRRVAVRAVGEPAATGPADLVLICVKSQDTAGAAGAVRGVLSPGAVVLSLQNGVRNPGLIAEALPGVSVGGVAVYLGCQRTGPGAVTRRPSRDPATGALRDRLVGGPPGAIGRRLVAVAAAAGVAVQVVERPETALWAKLVANASLNTVTALGRARVGRVFADPAAVALMLAIGGEVERVAAAAGVPLEPGAARRYVADARRRLPPDGGSSTLFDLEAGRPLEREALVGAVVREGSRLGVDTPHSRACDALLQLVDPGRLSGSG